jgi:murein DD-endopeptidase
MQTKGINMKRALLALSLGIIVLLTGVGSLIHAQSPASLEGAWEGTLAADQDRLRLVLEIEKASDGIYRGTLVSVDQGGVRLLVDRLDVKGDRVRFETSAVGGSFDGLINADQTRIKGTWTQGRPFPLELARTATAVKAAEATESTKPPATASPPLVLSLDLQTPIAPTPFPVGGKIHLVYELHITNFTSRELLLSRVEVMDGDSSLARFEGLELNGLLMRPEALKLTHNRSIGTGLRTIAFLWVTLNEGARLPASLRHLITVGAETVEGAAVTVSTAKPIVLAAPLRGSDWFAANGPSNGSIHRRALIPLAGQARISQRFATDWMRLGKDGKAWRGDSKKNQDWHAYGAEVLAVADGVVAAVKDGIPENVPLSPTRAAPMTVETISGNHVILDLGNGKFAFYAHLQPNSIRVKVGQRVQRGEVLGLVGNSGNSDAPHLHFHVSDGRSPLGAEGLPFVFESFEVSGTASLSEVMRQGRKQQPGTTQDKRVREMPVENLIVNFH